MANFVIDSDDPVEIVTALGKWLGVGLGRFEYKAHDRSLEVKFVMREPNPKAAARGAARSLELHRRQCDDLSCERCAPYRIASENPSARTAKERER